MDFVMGRKGEGAFKFLLHSVYSLREVVSCRRKGKDFWSGQKWGWIWGSPQGGLNGSDALSSNPSTAAQLWNSSLLSNLRALLPVSPNPYPLEMSSCPSQENMGSDSVPAFGEVTLEVVYGMTNRRGGCFTKQKTEAWIRGLAKKVNKVTPC